MRYVNSFTSKINNYSVYDPSQIIKYVNAACRKRSVSGVTNTELLGGIRSTPSVKTTASFVTKAIHTQGDW